MGAEATKRHIGLAVGLMFTFIPVAGVGAATVGSSAGEATAAATASATAGYVAAKGSFLLFSIPKKKISNKKIFPLLKKMDRS